MSSPCGMIDQLTQPHNYNGSFKPADLLPTSELLIGVCHLTPFYMEAQARLLSSTRLLSYSALKSGANNISW